MPPKTRIPNIYEEGFPVKFTSIACTALLLSACSSSSVGITNPSNTLCSNQLVMVNGKNMWVDLEGNGQPTVVFEAGGGNDSSVWSTISPKIRALGVRTFVYDRAGLGKSDVDPSPYSIQREVKSLRQAMDHCMVKGRIIIVAHSYGGFLSLLTASENPRVKGLVLLDAVVPGFYTPARTNALLQEYRPQYAELRSKAPQLALAMIPMMEAYPSTAVTLDQALLPRGLPVIDIVAEHPFGNTPDDINAWKEAHTKFVTADSHREAIEALGSSHHIEVDEPDVVVNAISKMVRIVGAKK